MHSQRILSYRTVLFLGCFFLCSGPLISMHAQYFLQLNSQGTYITQENSSELQLAEFTLECWFSINDTGVVMHPDTTGAAIVPIIAKGFPESTSGAGMNYLLGFRKEDRVLYAVFEEQAPAGNPRTYSSLEGFTSLQAGTWYYAAVTYNGYYLTLYLNGNVESRLEVGKPPLTSCLNDLTIGTALDANGTEHGLFDGLIDGIRIWNYARSQAELRQHLNHEILTQQPGLVIAINLNEGNGNSIQAVGLLNTPFLVGEKFTWHAGSPPEMLLPPECLSTPLLKIGLISDPQYCDCDAGPTRFYRESLHKLPAAIDTMNSHNVDFVMNLGDMIDRYPQSYDSMVPLYNKLLMPGYNLLGNHEFDLIPDSVKHTITNRLNMPDRYYDFSYRNWHFLVLDGTELAEYSRVLHPELQEEGDSLWQRVQGKINAYDWNGGIGRNQLEWMRQKLTACYERSEPVILFSHHQVFPFNDRKNLWNDTAVVELISEFPNVVAFINGHNHDGSYGFHEGIHYLSQRAMLETQDENSFSILSVYPDRIEIDGQGLNRDRVWLYDRDDTISRVIRISNNLIRSRDTSGTFIGVMSLQQINGTRDEADFKLSNDTLDGQLFFLSGDSLFLNTNADLSGKEKYQVLIQAMNCLKQQFAVTVTMEFDSTTIHLLNPLPDTVMDIKQKYFSLSIADIFLDSSRYGLTYRVQTQHPETATVLLEAGNLICQPHQMGDTRVFVTAVDTFTHQQVTDTFLLQIRRLYNLPPYVIHFVDSVFLQVNRDTLVLIPDTLFADPDGDTLIYTSDTTGLQVVKIEYDAGKFLIIPIKSGESEVILIASDNYGGEAQLIFYITVQEPILDPVHKAIRNSFAVQYDLLNNEIIIESPLVRKEIQVSITEISGKYSGILFGGILPGGRNHLTLGDFYPPGVYILSIKMGNDTFQTHKIVITR
jgi:manganese-dependent ADP-ribose/CDP-alcohol diphosphatase